MTRSIPSTTRGRARLVTMMAVGAMFLTACAAANETATTTSVAPVVDDAPVVDATPVVDAAPAVDDAPADAPVAAPPEQPDVGSTNCDLFNLNLGIDEVIQFSTGSTGTTVSNALDASSLHAYSLDAAAGQAMVVTVTGGATVDIVEGDAPFTVLASGTNVTASPLPYTGTYFLDVYSTTCSALSYDLTVEIPAGGAAAPIPPAADEGRNAGPCRNYTEFTTASGQNWPMRLCQKGDLVREVQQALKDLGFNVDVDGFFGPGTATAVGQWRGDGDGELIPADLEILFAFDEDDKTVVPDSSPPTGGLTPPSVQNDFVGLADGFPFISQVQLVVGDQLAVQLLDAGDGTDPLLELFGPDGVLVVSDDDSGEGPLDSKILITATSAGSYQVVATTINGVDGQAQLQVVIN